MSGQQPHYQPHIPAIVVYATATYPPPTTTPAPTYPAHPAPYAASPSIVHFPAGYQYYSPYLNQAASVHLVPYASVSLHQPIIYQPYHAPAPTYSHATTAAPPIYHPSPYPSPSYPSPHTIIHRIHLCISHGCRRLLIRGIRNNYCSEEHRSFRGSNFTGCQPGARVEWTRFLMKMLKTFRFPSHRQMALRTNHRSATIMATRPGRGRAIRAVCLMVLSDDRRRHLPRAGEEMTAPSCVYRCPNLLGT
jgi:hypothetical protein